MQKEKITSQITANGNDLVLLKKHFPHCFDKNGDFDFDKFKNQLQSNKIDFSKESYSMDWLGKSYARLLASDPATTLLREDIEWNSKEENRTSENLLLKGDNLEVLKHLSNAYHEKIKMIYIDPPYNTGSDGFVYEDDRTFTVNEFSKLAGVDTEQAKKILSFVKTKSNSHSAWLTFMYPRLYIARQLLKDDGVIFVSIDDNEVAQLRILMDEIFGEENFVALAPRKTGAGSAATRSESELRKLNDYIFIYQKSNVVFNQKIVGEKLFPYKDDVGNYSLGQFQASGSDSTRSARPNMFYPIYLLDNGSFSTNENEKNIIDKILPAKVNGEDGRWLWKSEKFEQDKEMIVLEKNKLYRKIYFDPQKDNKKYQVEKAWFESFTNASGTNRVNKLFTPHKALFNNPKPVDLIGFLFNLINTNGSEDIIVLDFFAGSGTTADAVMQLNAEDKANGKAGNRKYILVQLPEAIDTKTSKTAYDFVKNDLATPHPTIFDITKERIIRAAKKIQVEAQDKEILKGIDFGFKIFETAPIWEDYELEADEFESQVKLFDESKLTADDIQTLLTTWKTYDGISLTQDLEVIDLGGYIAYYGANKLYLMDKGFRTENLKKLIEKVDIDSDFSPSTIIAFGYHFESKVLREIAENTKNYSNKKNTEIDFVIRY
jgi:adenine-specific DNA-methyltransferase